MAITRWAMPAGIGPEIVARLFQRGEAPAARSSSATSPSCGAPPASSAACCRWRALDDAGQLADVPPDCLPVLQVAGLPADLLEAPLGRVDARCGAAAAACIEQAVRLVQQAGEAGGDRHRADPQGGARRRRRALSRPHRDAAGAGAQGGAPPPVRMMLANDELRTVLVTIHVSLRKAIDAVTFDAVLETIRIAHAAAVRRGLARAAHRRGRPQPARRRGRPVRRRGERRHRPGRGGGARRGHRRERPASRPTRCSCAPATRRITRASSTSSSP